MSRDKLLDLGNLLIVCLYDWVAVCRALNDRMRTHWLASHDRYETSGSAVAEKPRDAAYTT